MSRRLWTPLLVLLAAALALPALGQSPTPPPPDTRSQAQRDAERDLWIPGRSRALRAWLVKAAPTALANEAALVPTPGQDGWTPYAAWTDVVELSAPEGQAAPSAPADPNAGPRYLYAATSVDRAQAGPAEVAIGAAVPVHVWVNGEDVGEVPADAALARDRVRLPVRLRQGANLILLRAEQVAGPSRLTIRLLAPGQPVPETFTPFLTEAPGRLHVDTDLGPRRGTARVAALAPGGRLVEEREGPRGTAPVTFDTSSWPDGPYEIRVTASDPFGASLVAWLPWYKGDPTPAARRLLERAAAATGDDGASGHWRMLGALITDRAGADLSAIWSQPTVVRAALMEASELEAGDAAEIRPSGFVRLAWIDRVDGSAQFCRAYLPSDYDPARTWPTVVNLHGFNPQNPPYIGFWNIDKRHDEQAERWHVIWIEPHGRANTQYSWIGEHDVLNCLREAQRRLRIDADRTYLTGESMGGSGTWLIGARHPDLFAAIAPIFGGWDFRVQPNSPIGNPAADRPMERWFAEAHSSFASAEQLIATPVFVHHGDADPAVDVNFSRHIVRRLQRWGYDVRYREYPGWMHEDLQYRDEITPWFLGRRRAEAPREIRIRSIDLEGANAWWVRVEGAERPLELIEADAEMIAPGRLRLDTRNVAALALSPPPPLAGSGPLQIVWNGRAVEARPGAGGTFRVALPDAPRGPLHKRAGLEGGLSNAFDTPFVIVVGTQARDPEMRTLVRDKAEALAVHWNTWQHVRPRMVDDTAVTPEMERSLTLVLIGGPDENALSRRIVPRLPLRVTPTAVTVDGRSFAARDAIVDFIYPSPLAADRFVMVVAPTSTAGMRLWDPTGYWHALLGFRTNFYDWTLRDRRQTSPVPGLAADRDWIASGIFDQSWRRDDRWTFLGVGREGTQ